MNTEDIETWVNETDKLCRKHFEPKVANVTVHYIMGKWTIRIDSPKVYVESKQAETAIDDADRELSIHINSVTCLARTLGLEAAE